MEFKNPNGPATKRQLWLLHILMKTDTRNLNITVAEANKRITALKGNTQSEIHNNGEHYCLMYGYPPPNHHWSNHKWRWKACNTSTNKQAITRLYNNYVDRLPYQSLIKAYVLVQCKSASLARLMLLRGDNESKFARIISDSRVKS